jgi:isoquinoline 1-oxidoreductase beta subunit
MVAAISRRTFVKSSAAAGGVLLIGIRIAPSLAAGAEILAAWIRVDADGRTTLLVNATEMGQGAQSGLAQILAEELELDWRDVRIDFAPIEPAYYGVWQTYQTGGSGSVRGMFEKLRTAGATARSMLVEAAARRWNVSADSCIARLGSVHHEASGRHATYGELAADAARLPQPEKVALKPREQWQLIGKSPPRLDSHSKVDGTAVFGIDVVRPGMLSAAIAHCPTLGGTLESVDPAPALRSPHVSKVVQLDNAVAVVARDYWSARRALQTLEPVWRAGAGESIGSSGISKRLHELTSVDGAAFVPKGDNEADARRRCADGLAQAARILERTYEAPLLSHSPMEPMNGTALVRDGRAELWLPTQVQSEMRTAVAKALGYAESAVTIHTTFLGGGFGRRLKTDYGIQAALIAREVGKPVKLIWSREEDTQHGFYRPAAVTRMRAGIDASGAVTAVHAQVACVEADAPVGGLANQLYSLPNFLITYAGWNPGVPLGAWRSVDASQNLFFLESFVDELARATSSDPLEFRRRMLSHDARALRVLNAAAQLADWNEPLPKGHGRGVAFLRGFGSLTAEVAEVSVSGGDLRVHRVSCAVDCGTAVNPQQIRAQFEGGVIFGLSAAAFGEITVEQGQVQQANFDSYPLVRIDRCPRIDVEILESPREAIGGIGEPPVPPVAPAIANAIFAATGKRVRRLPFSREGLQLARNA